MKIGAWIEAMRLRTLPVSVSGVIAACGYCLLCDSFRWLPALLCLVFAILAQIASNFANEYYDYKAGLDKPGRVGPRRGVTEGDITPGAMKAATFLTLAVACAVGLSLIYWGGWWLIAVGVCIALGVLAYSTGPYPLSHHALGEVAVIFFFGIIPVNFTFYLQAGDFDLSVAVGSVAVGLLGSSILLVNNYRDMEDDAAVGKITFAVKFGRTAASSWYLINGFLAVALMLPTWMVVRPAWLAVPTAFLMLHTFLWFKLNRLRGTALNPMLGLTAIGMLLYCTGFLLAAI